MNVGTYMKLGVVGAAVLGVVFFMYQTQVADVPRNLRIIRSAQDAIRLFPTTVSEIEQLVQVYKQEVQEMVDAIIAVPAEERTYENTMQALDDVQKLSNMALANAATGTLKYVSPDNELRDAAQKSYVEVEKFFVDLESNLDLYHAVQEYADNVMPTENLAPEQRRFVEETLDDFKRAGLHLPEEQRARVVQLKKELAELTTTFGTNIARDNRTITVSREQLAGLTDEYVETLKRTDEGAYVVGVDYPTYRHVMRNCAVSDTRRQLLFAYNNRGYPENKAILEQVIAKRDEMAKLLGFNSYAAYCIDNQMIGSLERTESFLRELLDRASVKEQQEFERLTVDLPPSVELRSDGKLNQWDGAFLSETYKKKHLNVDEQEVAKYFPMEKTVEGLLAIYEKFFGLTFARVPVSGMWHDEVELIQVYDVHTKDLYGYLFLDLYPRDNKYNHACHIGVVRPTIRNGKPLPAVSVVLANFTKSTPTKPSLLKRGEVETFFHEFGHALHNMLGVTKVASFSGTEVKKDFVELPSQMLEEWLWDKDILKNLSSHYQTGEPMPDDLIERQLELKRFSTGSFVQGQIFLATLSLEFYKAGAQKDLDALTHELYEKIITHEAHSQETHFYTRFSHLTGYGPRYYGYLWSKVFALDLFEEIKKHGLLNPEIGRKYVQEVIGKGGSEDPNTLLVNFLGREPNQDAFLRDLGL